jgi:hypothetical protein
MGLEDYTEGRVKPGKYDRRHRILISGVELQALKLLAMPESFGLEGRIQRYEGKRPIGLWSACWIPCRWNGQTALSIRVCVEETSTR